MEQAIVKQLDKNLKCDRITVKDKQIILRLSSTQNSIKMKGNQSSLYKQINMLSVQSKAHTTNFRLFYRF